jgi:MFS family permease
MLAGALLATGHGGAMLGSALGGRLGGGRGVALAGAALGGAGLLLVAQWGAGTALPWLLAALALQGFGIGLFTLAYTDMITAAMRREDRGVAGSLTLLMRTLGVVLAASLLTLVFSRFEDFLTGFAAAFWLAGLLPLLALFLIPRRIV